MFQSDMAFLTSTQTAADVARGVSRLLLQQGYSPILEFTLANGRRLDVAALGADGTLLGVEIKVALADLRGDIKWPEYLEFCEHFYFAIPPDFPDEHVPPGTGLIVADRYGGAIVRPAAAAPVHASRRKAVTLRFAKVAADRLAALLALAEDPRQPAVVMSHADH
ncbi:MAG TPA: MmcB family DNA repair protein [Rhizomicrobium sp.]|jgi:hypothetical protein|nr:MmcB family DNA repair protein [Rhizomicrobium sp.]